MVSRLTCAKLIKLLVLEEGQIRLDFRKITLFSWTVRGLWFFSSISSHIAITIWSSLSIVLTPKNVYVSEKASISLKNTKILKLVTMHHR